ncbi:MAG: DNA polymerase IV [Clostridia bacterium]|nr:DNA polymerase IV [Clostridia bacterium]
MTKTILHCDLNNFYASVEQKLHPEYDGLPLAVCGNPEVRHGIVLAKNQLAKQAGIQTGEAIWISKKKCPNIVFVPPHYDEYVKYSKQVFEIYTTFTDKVESFGIDECWLDVTGSLKLFGKTGEELANIIRETVKKKTGLTISVGVSFTKTLAKLGSDLKKPDAVTVLDKEHYMERIGDLAPNEMIMIGRRTAQKLTYLNIRTISDLANADVALLRSHFGVVGENLINEARGEGDDKVAKYFEHTVPKSVSNGTTTPRDITTFEEAKVVVYALAELVAVRLRSHNLVANGVGIYLKNNQFDGVTKQIALKTPTSNASTIAKSALDTMKAIYNFNQPLRAITVAAIRLTGDSEYQISLFEEDNEEREEKLEKSVDKIRDKYGYRAIKRGVVLKNDLTGNLHEDDDFRPFHQSKTT